MSAIVMVTGIFLALLTGLTMMVTAVVVAGRVVPADSTVVGPWLPPSEWLWFVMGLVTITFSVKRATHTALWRKPTDRSTTTRTTTSTSTTPP